jgi:Domain of unknown function (DUF397)
MIRSEPPFSILPWRKATKSGVGGCLLVAAYNGRVAVTDSKNPQSEVLVYTSVEWHAFLDGAKRGEFDDVLPG